MNRGDIWQRDLGGRAGRRPALVLTRQGVIPHLNTVTVAEITTHGKGYPTEVPLGHLGDLQNVVRVTRHHSDGDMEAKVEQMNRVHKRPFKLAGSLKTHLSEDATEQVFRELRKGWTPRTTDYASSAPSRGSARRRK